MIRASWLVALPILAACVPPERRNPAAPPAPAAPAPRAPATTSSVFVMSRAMIPMRDGVRLETVVFAPRSAAAPLPILLSRTPYGVPSDDKRLVGADGPKELIADGYIFVLQNVRGRFQSEGTFVLSRSPRDRNDPRATDESSDAYDTIEWLVHNVPNNSGRVGMTGGSYSAWTATMALLEPHPALKVIVEAASPADQFLGDDAHHNGALRLSTCFEYSVLFESSKEQNAQFRFDRLDTYDWYLTLGSLSHVDERYFHGKFSSWTVLVDHPNYDEFWQKQAFASHLAKTTVPVLNTAGWFDQEDFYGPLKIYELLEKTDAEHLNYLVVGPWNHGGWSSAGRKLASLDFGSDSGTYYREKISAPWLARWLHDKRGEPETEARIFVTGTNEWRKFDHWPPSEGVTPTRLYLRAGSKLSFEPPPEDGAGAFDEYVSDPANPVPYVRRPVRPIFQGSEWPTWQVLDQRFVDHRPDVRSWQSDVLERDLVVAGDISAELFASTSGTDGDWIVKLIDVFPEANLAAPAIESASDEKSRATDLSGYQLMISGEVMRGRFRQSFVRPEPLVADKFLRYSIGLHSRAHAFLRGHRIMVQVQSTWFPLIDRNPQKYVNSIFTAKEADYVKATQRIGRSPSTPSAIVLPILAP